MDRSRSDEGDLDGQVVERPRSQPGQSGQLGAGFDLEYPDRVGAAEHLVHGFIVVIDLRPVDEDPGVAVDESDHLVQGGQHAQTEQVEFDQVHGRAVVFVPLDDGAVAHRRLLDRHDFADGTVGEDHPAGMDAQMPRGAEQILGDLEHRGGHGRVLGIGQARPPVARLRERILLSGGIPEAEGGVPDGRFRPVGDDIGDLGGPVAAEMVVDVLDDLFAATGFDVDVDVRVPLAVRGQEPVEEQPVFDGVDGGDAQDKADRRVRRRAPPLAEDAHMTAEFGDVEDDEEVSAEAQLRDHVHLPVQLFPGPGVLGSGSVAGAAAFGDEAAQIRLPLGLIGHRSLRQVGSGRGEDEGAFPTDPHRIVQGLPREACEHLLTGVDACARRRRQPSGQFVQGLPRPHRGAHLGRLPRGPSGEVDGIAGHDRQTRPLCQIAEVAQPFVVIRGSVPAEFDGDPVGSEECGEFAQSAESAVIVAQRSPQRTFAAAGEDHPVAVFCREFFEAEEWAVLLTAQIRLGDGLRELVVALDAVGEDEQVGGVGVGLAGDLLGQTDGQLGAEHGVQSHLGGGVGEADGAVESVVVGQRQGGQSGGGTGGDERFGVGGSVEEAELGMHMQLRPVHTALTQQRSAAWPLSAAGAFRALVAAASVRTAGADRDLIAVRAREGRGVGAVGVFVDGTTCPLPARSLLVGGVGGTGEALAFEAAGELRPRCARVRESHRGLLLSGGASVSGGIGHWVPANGPPVSGSGR